MIKKLLFISLLLGLITSCGFRLKGSYDLPESLKTLHLTSSKTFSPLSETVKNRLLLNNVKLVTNKQAQISELQILPEEFQRQTLSLLPNGQIAEYKLVYLVQYRLFQPNKEPREFRFELSREFQDDPNNALAKERERELILSELRVMASDRILSQLNSIM